MMQEDLDYDDGFSLRSSSEDDTGCHRDRGSEDGGISHPLSPDHDLEEYLAEDGLEMVLEDEDFRYSI